MVTSVWAGNLMSLFSPTGHRRRGSICCRQTVVPSGREARLSGIRIGELLFGTPIQPEWLPWNLGADATTTAMLPGDLAVVI